MEESYFEKVKGKISSWIIRHARGPRALPILFTLSFAESVFFPIPVEAVFVPFIIAHKERWRVYVYVATIASILGGVVGYAVGFYFYDLFGRELVALYGFEEKVQVVSKLLSDNVFGATFLSAFTPIPYKVFTLSAGLLGAPFLLFFIASTLGRGLRFLAVGYVTMRCGEAIAKVVFKRFTNVTLAIFLVVAVGISLYLIL